MVRSHTARVLRSDAQGLSRRRFIALIGRTSGALVLSASWPASGALLKGLGSARPERGEVGITAWVRIAPDNTVTLVVSQAEIGQGISTTLPALLADELGADWSKIRLVTAPYDLAYRNPRVNWMFTGNSESVQSFYELMRRVGASPLAASRARPLNSIRRRTRCCGLTKT